MPERAHISSVAALESFRASLIIYLSKARPALDEVGADLLRTRGWLQNDQRVYWERELRRRSKKLEQAQQALFSARLSAVRRSTDAEQVAVRRAKQALEEAETKLKCVKKWTRDFDSRVEPVARQLEQLRDLLAVHIPEAIAHLGQTIQTLHDYAGVAPAPATSASGPERQAEERDPMAAAPAGSEGDRV